MHARSQCQTPARPIFVCFSPSPDRRPAHVALVHQIARPTRKQISRNFEKGEALQKKKKKRSSRGGYASCGAAEGDSRQGIVTTPVDCATHGSPRGIGAGIRTDFRISCSSVSIT